MLKRSLRRESPVDPRNNIVAVLLGPDGEVKDRAVMPLPEEMRKRLRRYYGKNIVTNAGDQYYAEAVTAAGSVLTVAGMRLGTTNTAPDKTDTDVGGAVANGSAAIDSGYPLADDQDADNTGAGADIVTWRSTFGTAIANASGIQEVAIVNHLGTPNAALMRGTFTSFEKTDSDTLKMFVNHAFTGV